MGLLDKILGGDRRDPARDAVTTSDQALPRDPSAFEAGVGKSGNALVEKLISVGIDGAGPFDSAKDFAEAALRDANGNVDRAIRDLSKGSRRIAAGGGFVTGLGGIVTAAVALPANVLEFYLLATRQVAAIAHLRGYDLDKPETRSAVLLALVGAESDDVLRRAGVNMVPGGVLARVAVDQLPPAVRMVINKAVGFRLINRLGAKFLTRMGRALPVIGGVMGAALDFRMMKKIGKHAATQFPPVSAVR